MPLPKAIHRHAGEKRVRRRGEPVGEHFDASFMEIDLGWCERPARRHFVIWLGPIRVDVAVPLNKQPGGDRFEFYIGLGQVF